ncbi:hypothetical protein BDV98DRAFT_371638 [Pterulicium gracile]|uniref:Uncharacterized protein n=1 Tax=Pterulicium gracile TaxID=1884261 RepID=A0A5C3Q0S5_9AGAR|nr:hypothetical protein BDV98DRAFT_371638 [Pterula gracilis]
MAFLFTTNCMSPLALNTIKSPSLSSPYRSIEIKQPTFEDDLFSFAPSFDLHTSPSYGVLSSSEYNIFLNPFSPTRHAQDDQFHWPATPEKTPFSYYTTPDGASQDSQDSSIALSPFTSTPDKASQVSQASSIALSPFTCTPTKISQAGSSLATSPLTPLSEVLPARYKRSRPLTTIQDASPCPQQVFKKPRIETRTFPSTVEVDLDQFPLFYRKFHASRYTATVPEEKYASLYLV